MKVYDTLYDWQKLFVDNTPYKYYRDLYGVEKIKTILSEETIRSLNTSESEKIGFFLRMGVGKTKITVAKAETNNADCVFVTSLRSKVVAGEEEGEFGYELKLAGYKVFYAHKAFDEEGKLNILSLDSKRSYALFEESIKKGEKIAYVFNHEHIGTKKGYARLVLMASQYKNITWIVDEAHKLANRTATVSKRVYDMLYSFSTPEIKVKSREVNRDIKLAQEQGDLDKVANLENLLRLSKTNVFRDNVKGFYLATGTPNSNGYQSFYWLLMLLGHEFKWEGQVILDDEIVDVKYRDWKAFFEEYCVEDLWMRKLNPYGRAIKGYKNIDKLLDLVQQYSFFAKTENYFKGMPTRLVEMRRIQQDDSYLKMTNSDEKNPYYRVLDGYIADTPALLSLRARQLASGFMGNAEHADFYHANKVVALAEILEENPGNYIIFYNYTPELDLILTGAEDLGYKIDIYNGREKSLDNYRKSKGNEEVERNILVANIDSGSAALNLQKYNKVIFFALPDKFKDYDQGIGRVERLGQKSKEVSVICFVTKGTVEERVWKQLQKGEDYTEKMYERDIIWRELK